MQLRSGIVTVTRSQPSAVVVTNRWAWQCEAEAALQQTNSSTTKHVTDDDDATVPAPVSVAAHFLVRARSVTSLAMAVAAMVARQMREQRRGEPDDTWTQEQVDLFELQRLSKATFKVEE